MQLFARRSPLTLILAASLFMVLLHNFTFFQKVREIYPFTPGNTTFMTSMALILLCLMVFLLSLTCFRYTLKPVLIATLISSSITAYFIDKYGVVIDDTMLQNMAATNTGEAADLLSLKLFLYMGILGLLPSVFIYKIPVDYKPFKTAVFAHFKTIFGALLLIVLTVFGFSKYYASFFREHKPVRSYSNPVFFVYSAGKYLNSFIKVAKDRPAVVLDSIISDKDVGRELIIFVVGETARADRFSLNGYERETNPRLSREDIFNFTDVTSCGTSTAVSVPCMFSFLPKDEYNNEEKYRPNLITLLDHTNIALLWRDNNSNQQKVARSALYEDYHDPELNTFCDGECQDEDMLVGLDAFIAAKTEGDIFIVLHQMGNHGPAYYKRYPDRFEVFVPACKSTQLDQCSLDEINNAYDNAILYTDHFLGEVIDFLKPYSDRFQTAMVYCSDHGESLGEKGVYLHGLPYFMAPDTQTQVPLVMWFGPSFAFDRENLRAKLAKSYSHDNIFHTILGLMEVETSLYDRSLDILKSDP